MRKKVLKFLSCQVNFSPPIYKIIYTLVNYDRYRVSYDRYRTVYYRYRSAFEIYQLALEFG